MDNGKLDLVRDMLATVFKLEIKNKFFVSGMHIFIKLKDGSTQILQIKKIAD